MRQIQPMSDKRLAEIESRVIEASYPRYDYPYSTDAKRDMSDLLAEVERLRARERPLLVLLREVAKGEPLPEAFMWQARGWLQAEEEQEGGGDGA